MQEELRRVKKQELELRAECVEELLDGAVKAGTKKFELNERMQVAVTIPKRVEVDKDLFNTYKGELEAKGLIGDTGVIELKPSVKVAALKHMDDEHKVRFSDLFVSKAGSPTVKFDMIKD